MRYYWKLKRIRGENPSFWMSVLGKSWLDLMHWMSRVHEGSFVLLAYHMTGLTNTGKDGIIIKLHRKKRWDLGTTMALGIGKWIATLSKRIQPLRMKWSGMSIHCCCSRKEGCLKGHSWPSNFHLGMSWTFTSLNIFSLKLGTSQ